MAWFRAGGGGIPSSLKAEMNDVLNKKFGTFLQYYPPEGWPDNVNLLGPLPIKTASGAIASFSDGADDVPLKSGVFGIVPSGGGGTPSSPVPIVGRSGMTISHCGKNLLPNKTYQRNASTLRIGTDNIDGRIRLKRGNYSISVVTNKNPTIHYTMDGYNTMTVAKTVDGNRHYGMFSIIDEEVLVFFHLSQSGITAEDVSNMQLESGTVTTDYEPYEAPTTHAVSFGSTVYGGEYSMDGGLKETAGKAVFTGSETWQLYSNETFWYTTLAADNIKVQQNCTTSNGVVVRYQSTNGQLRVYLSANVGVVDTQTDMNALLSNGVSFVYPYETPTETEIEPTPINSRLGNNNLWCDTGDAEVEYYADINLALNQ